jgi:hypothetical protein
MTESGFTAFHYLIGQVPARMAVRRNEIKGILIDTHKIQRAILIGTMEGIFQWAGVGDS